MTKIVIALHKPYEVPKDDVYLPLQVGAAGKESLWEEIARDDSGENISKKNPQYCELTALYWAWKNLDADAIGLVHYRRYFKGRRSLDWLAENERIRHVMTGEEADALMQDCDIAVPLRRNYYIETLYTHYSHTLDGKHLDVAREIIAERCPEYEAACVTAYTRTWGYMFNMCIMHRAWFDAYCAWLFPILEELEVRLAVDMQSMSDFEARLFGRVSEILFNVWIEYQRQVNPSLRIREVETVHVEPENWAKLGTAFWGCKFFGNNNKKSFLPN